MISTKKPSKEDIDNIFFDDEIYSRIADDVCPSKGEFRKVFDYSFYEYFAFYLDGKIIGLSNIEQNGRFHFAILKKYRKHSKKCLKLALEYFNRPLFCEIPTLYKEVINFAKKNKFIEIGFVDNFYIKGNIKYKYLRLDYEFS